MTKEYDKKLREWAKRRTAIYTKRMKGKSLNEIAREYEISITSVERIVQKEIAKRKKK